MKVRLLDSITYPFAEDRWMTKLGIGCALSIIPIAHFISIGYVLRVLRQAISGNNENLPEWDSWMEDLVQGFKCTLVILAYVLAGMFFLAVLGGVPFIAGLIFLAFIYLLPMAVVNFVLSGSLMFAFNVKQIAKKIRKNIDDYTLACFVMLGFFCISLLLIPRSDVFVATLANIFHRVILCFFAYYAMIVLAKLFGDVFRGNKIKKKQLADTEDSSEEEK